MGSIVAASFARIFFRNAVNIGLPILICPEFAREAQDGADASVDFGSGRILQQGREFRAESLPPIVQEIIAAGGLVALTRGRLARQQASVEAR